MVPLAWVKVARNARLNHPYDEGRRIRTSARSAHVWTAHSTTVYARSVRQSGDIQPLCVGTGQVLTLKYLLRKGFNIEIESSTVENRASVNYRKEK